MYHQQEHGDAPKPVAQSDGVGVSVNLGHHDARQSQRCSECILPAEYPGIEYDESGQCNYCRRWKRKWDSLDFAKQAAQLEGILGAYRGKLYPYDCLIGLSGGKDSVYAAYILKKHNMRPLACTFDNGFLTETALHNISSTVNALGIGHVVVHAPPGDLHRLYRHCVLTAGEFCSVYNVGIRSALYRMAKCYGIKLVVTGQSNRTEASSPKEYFTCSSGYFQNVGGTVASKKELAGFMYMSQFKRALWHLRRTVVYLQLPSYVPWKEEEFKEELARNVDWRGSVGEQHADCRMSDAKEYLKLKHFGVTELTAKLSSLVRDRQLSREDALVRIQQQVDHLQENEASIREQIRKEFDLSESQLDEAIRASHIPYISKADTFLSNLKNLQEVLRYRKQK
ncbi:MAG TPA: hypothetical protein DD670_15385 [Planctomycetaceae bacterium]|nr:hypothetical protein [Planctomycetaceae bacterium]